MNSPSYEQVPSSDQSDKDAAEEKKERAKKLEVISSKMHALFWVILSIMLIVYLDIWKVIMNDTRINRIALNLAVFTFAANIVICLYLTFWLPFVKKVTLPWEIYCPRMIPTATALGLLCMASSIIAMWPVWGFLSPFIIFFLCLGIMMSTHFIPWPF